MDEILDLFSNQERKLKRKLKQEKNENDKKLRMISEKKNLQDSFNNALTLNEFENYSKIVKNPISIELLQDFISMLTIKDLKYSKNSNHLIDFLNCCIYCDDWLEKKFQEIGWSSDPTNYIFRPLCPSTDEVLHETLVCFKMGCKLMIQYQLFVAKTSR